MARYPHSDPIGRIIERVIQSEDFNFPLWGEGDGVGRGLLGLYVVAVQSSTGRLERLGAMLYDDDKIVLMLWRATGV